jgi:hypothetical protein
VTNASGGLGHADIVAACRHVNRNSVVWGTPIQTVHVVNALERRKRATT